MIFGNVGCAEATCECTSGGALLETSRKHKVQPERERERERNVISISCNRRNHTSVLNILDSTRLIYRAAVAYVLYRG